MKKITFTFTFIFIGLINNVLAQDELPQISIMKDSINTIEITIKSDSKFDTKTKNWMKSLTNNDTTITDAKLDSMIQVNGSTYTYKGFKENAIYHKATGRTTYMNMDYVMVITKNGNTLSITFDLPQFYSTQMQKWAYTYGYFFDPLKGGAKYAYKETVPGVNSLLNSYVKEYITSLN